jgi:oxaloacetate decarboxylase alpha subunit
MVVNAPLAGNIFRIEKNVGDAVSDDETIIVLEAMKMETTIKTPVSGKIKQIFIKNGAKVQSGDPLFEVV